MDCDDIRDSFRHGVLPEGSEFVAHAQTCLLCSQILMHGGDLGKRLGTYPSTRAAEGLLTEIFEGLAARRRWSDRVKELHSPVRLVLAAFAALTLCALVFVAMRRPDWDGAPPRRATLILVAYALALAACTKALLAPLSRARRSDVLAATIVVGFSLPWLIAVCPSGALQDRIAHWGLRAFGCFAFGTGFGAPFLALLWLLDRTSPRSPLSGTLGFAALGLVGNIALVLHCALAEPLHLAVAHATLSASWLVVWVAFRRLSKS